MQMTCIHHTRAKHKRTNAFLQAQGNWSMSFWLFLFRDDNDREEGDGGFRGLFYKGPDAKQRTPAAWLITPNFRITSKVATTPIAQNHFPRPRLLPQPHLTLC